MKTKKVRPVLIETKEKSRLCHLSAKGKELNDLRFLTIEVPIILDSINYELILISLEDEEIEVGDMVYFGDFLLKVIEVLEDSLIIINPYDGIKQELVGINRFKKVIARQSQISLEYIAKVVEQYNTGYVEDIEIEMEGKIALDGHTIIGIEPKLINGFVTIVEKEPILYTEEEVWKLLNKCLDYQEHRLDNMTVKDWFEQNKKK